MSARVVDHSGLSAAQLAELADATARLTGLSDVIHWGLALVPPRMIGEIIAQDEYTHDVVLEWRDGRYLTFDTT